MLKGMTAEIANILLNDRFIAVDPSSCAGDSRLGWALFDKQQLVMSGTLTADGDIYERLRSILAQLSPLVKDSAPAMLVLEKLRSGCHNSLRWACSAVILSKQSGPVLEVAPIVWRKYVGKNYQKSDEQDAIEIGKAAIKEAAREDFASKKKGSKSSPQKRTSDGSADRFSRLAGLEPRTGSARRRKRSSPARRKRVDRKTDRPTRSRSKV